VDELHQMLDVKEARLNQGNTYAREQSFRSGRTNRTGMRGRSKAGKRGDNAVVKTKELLERRHIRHMKDIKLLTSNNCQKNHPYDFGYK
jgi:hypothetical protein